MPLQPLNTPQVDTSLGFYIYLSDCEMECKHAKILMDE